MCCSSAPVAMALPGLGAHAKPQQQQPNPKTQTTMSYMPDPYADDGEPAPSDSFDHKHCEPPHPVLDYAISALCGIVIIGGMLYILAGLLD
ncbi:MAG: hypothetical protein KGJ13_09905 [Patescibacteria group bacterium]|nr:hypothetical protein [Patescibacteria group bacterium]